MVEVETRDPAALKGARNQIQQAEEKLQAACKIMRDGGFEESADELLKLLRQARVWTQKDGWIDWLEKPE